MGESIRTFTMTFLEKSRESFGKILGVMDEVVLAIAIILVGWVVGNWVKKAIMKLGDKLKVTHLSDKIGFTHLLKKANVKMPPARIIGEFVKGYIITIFLLGAANILGFVQISQFLDSVIAYIPNILIALVIILLGMRVAQTTRAILENTLKLAHSYAAKTLALAAKYIIITFSILAALFELEIASDLVRIFFTGFIAMIVLAGGLAFGLGGKEVVKEFLEDLKSTQKRKKGHL